MKSFKVKIVPEARKKLRGMLRYIATESGSKRIAQSYCESIVKYCMGLAIFPYRNVERSDIFPGLHIANYKGNTIIAYTIDENLKTINVIDFFYGGQEYEAKI